MSAKYLWNKNDNLWLCLLTAGFSCKAVWHTPVPFCACEPWRFQKKRIKARHNVCKVPKRVLQEYLCSFKASQAGKNEGESVTSQSHLVVTWAARQFSVTPVKCSYTEEEIVSHVGLDSCPGSLVGVGFKSQQYIVEGAHLKQVLILWARQQREDEASIPQFPKTQDLLLGPFPNVHSNCCEDLHEPLGTVSSQSQ